VCWDENEIGAQVSGNKEKICEKLQKLEEER